jgi:phage terminase small subunit
MPKKKKRAIGLIKENKLVRGREASPMTMKEERFYFEYLKDRDGKNAAIRAGYAPSMAARTAKSLLLRPHIRKKLDLEFHKRAKWERVEKHRLNEEMWNFIQDHKADPKAGSAVAKTYDTLAKLNQHYVQDEADRGTKVVFNINLGDSNGKIKAELDNNTNRGDTIDVKPDAVEYDDKKDS